MYGICGKIHTWIKEFLINTFFNVKILLILLSYVRPVLLCYNHFFLHFKIEKFSKGWINSLGLNFIIHLRY